MYKIKCANPNCDSVLSTNNNQKIFYCSFGCSGKAYQLKQNYPQEYCDSYMVNEKEFYRNVNTQSDFRTRFIKSLNSYSDTINYGRGKIDTVIKFVINYLQHLKADLGEALNNTNINIDVFYVKEGLFAEVKSVNIFYAFIEEKLKSLLFRTIYFKILMGILY